MSRQGPTQVLEIKCPHCTHSLFPEVDLGVIQRQATQCENCKHLFVVSSRPVIAWEIVEVPDYTKPLATGSFDADVFSTDLDSQN